MKDNELDEIIKQTLKAREIPVTTPFDEIEQKIFERVKQNREKQRKRRLFYARVAAAVIVALGISISLLPAQSAVAFKAKLMQSIRHIGNIIHVTQSSDKPNIPSDPLTEKIAIIQAEVDFSIKIPAHIPAGFTLDNVEKNPNNENSQVLITYSNGDAMIIISQSKITGSHTSTININTDRGNVEKIEIGRFDGHLITFYNGTCNLIWESDYGVEYRIYGHLTPEQAKNIAASML